MKGPGEEDLRSERGRALCCFGFYNSAVRALFHRRRGPRAWTRQAQGSRNRLLPSAIGTRDETVRVADTKAAISARPNFPSIDAIDCV